ncbi:MAG: AEC family transporter, partial [Desulfosarcinaceae bacterium]
MHIIATIVPIFIIVLLGWEVHRRGFIPEEFLAPGNRLVFYVAIPAMIFQAVSKASFDRFFNPLMILLTLAAAALIYLAAWGLSRATRMDRSMSGTFIQTAGHGNLGYIGLAVAFYFLGEDGLTHAGIIAGFLMLLQNLLSVIALQAHAPKTRQKFSAGDFFVKVIGNPVILSVLAGMAFSLFHLPVPQIISRSLTIISGMALPMALLIIGASLSVERIRHYLRAVAGAGILKLVLLPALGWLFYILADIPREAYLPGLILLASPTATVSYVMSREMHGD